MVRSFKIIFVMIIAFEVGTSVLVHLTFYDFTDTILLTIRPSAMSAVNGVNVKKNVNVHADFHVFCKKSAAMSFCESKKRENLHTVHTFWSVKGVKVEAFTNSFCERCESSGKGKISIYFENMALDGVFKDTIHF